MDLLKRKKENNAPDDLIVGRKDIEKFTGKDLSFQFHWISAFGYPLVKRGGYPTISKKEFHEWASKWGVSDIPPNKITTEMLEKSARKMRIAEIENTTLIGIDAINECVHRPSHFIIDWMKKYESCPVKKIDGMLQVGKRDLLTWLEETGIPWGHYGIESTR